jgi:AcrR family transcriptional regulator
MVSKAVSIQTRPVSPGARERILSAAYELFSHYGINAVGIDTIIAQSGVAKMSLYRHFKSKEELVLAFLDQREARWTHEWLEAQILTASTLPEERLLAIFHAFDEWFQRPDFEGCSFMNVLLESTPNSPIHCAATRHLATIRDIISAQAQAAHLSDHEKFTQIWHFLMKGAIVSAHEGNRDAAKQACEAGAMLLNSWPRSC